jgi:hypothetical protein
VEEWQSVQTKTENTIPRVKEHWVKPDAEWHTINADGAFSASENCVGGDVIIRGHHGAPTAGKSHFSSCR